MDKGNTIRFSDQGPGIEKKRLVQQPGITSATADMKRFIRGVGSGFPLVKEFLDYRNGILSIDDNAKEGAVITLTVQPEPFNHEPPIPNMGAVPQEKKEPVLDNRSAQTLRLLYEQGELGPSDLVEPLGISVSTAYRILEGLDRKGLVESTANRKRILSSAGFGLIEANNPR
jgi:predicted transcriptional regulator